MFEIIFSLHYFILIYDGKERSGSIILINMMRVSVSKERINISINPLFI